MSGENEGVITSIGNTGRIEENEHTTMEENQQQDNEIDDTQQRRNDDDDDNDDDEVSPPPVNMVYVIDNDVTADVEEHRNDNDPRPTVGIGIVGEDDDDESSSNGTDDSASVELNQDDDDDDDNNNDMNDDDSSGMQRAMNERNEIADNLVESIVSSPFDMIQQKDDNGNYLLHIACRYCTDNYTDVILKLIEIYPVAVKKANNNGCFPLHIACCFGASKYVLLKLIEIYPEAAAIKYDVTIDSIISGFLRHPNDNEGAFPSKIAFRLRECEFCSQKFRFMVPITYINGNNNTTTQSTKPKNDDSSFGIGLYPLHMALRNDGQSKHVVMKLMEVFPQAVAIQCMNNDGRKDDYALHIACSTMRQRSKTVIQTLLELYPHALHEMNDEGNYPIHCAFQASQGNKFIKRLLEADPLLVIQQKDRNGNTPLHVASMDKEYRLRTKYIPILKYMEQYSDISIINIRNNNGETALHKACSHGFKEIVMTLLQHPDIYINSVDMLNETPLHKLCSLCRIRDKWHKKEIYEVAEILINQPFIITNHKNYCDMTPLDMLKTNIEDLEQQWEKRDEDEEVFMYSDGDSYCVLRRIQLLPACIKTMELLEGLPFKQRCDAYRFHLSDIDEIEDKSPHISSHIMS